MAQTRALAIPAEWPVFYVTEKQAVSSPIAFAAIDDNGQARYWSRAHLDLWSWLDHHQDHRITSEQPVSFVRPWWRFMALPI